jgi:acetyl esterase/lipase
LDEPPTFAVVGDWTASRRPPPWSAASALRAQGTPVEYRRYEGLGHGFGVGTGTSADGWVAEAVRFWSEVTQRRR